WRRWSSPTSRRATATSSVGSPRAAAAPPSRSTRSRAGGCGPARRRASAAWWTSSAACARRSPKPRRARLGEPRTWRVRYVERGARRVERGFGGFLQGRLAQGWRRDSDLARGLLSRAAPQAERDLRLLDQVLQSRDGAPVKVLAHCFCGL